MDLRERRALIQIEDNPDRNLDYVVDMKGHASYPGGAGRSTIEIRYVPDKWILRTGALDNYFKALGMVEWTSVEEIATTILNDLSNEIVCRWIQVIVSAPDDEHPSVDRHNVMIEDQQPGWDNPRLLDRLKRR